MLRLLALLALLPACVPDGKPPIYTSFVAGETGGPCSQGTDCKGGICFTTQFGGLKGTGKDALGGYCSQVCSIDQECGSGKCVPGADGNSYCTARCDGPSNCRDGYVCVTSKHCEPQGLYTFNCDPKADGGSCLLQDGTRGGCLRNALGVGLAGACIRSCSLGGTCPTAGTGCHYADATVVLGDPFKGLLCFYNAVNPPTSLGSVCSSSTECVSGANCVTSDNVNYTCNALCDSVAFSCKNGSDCVNFNPAGPAMVCNQ